MYWILSHPRRRFGVLLTLDWMLLIGLTSGCRPAKPAAEPARDVALRSLQDILHRQGLAAALDSLTRRSERDSALLRDGHQIAHALGRRAVADHGGDASVIRQCRPDFASGCYHGVVEASLGATGQIDVPLLERMCAGMESTAGPGAAFECLHGLGHGILGAVRYDIETALRDCDALSTPRRASSCYSGAFMEAVNLAVGAPAMQGAHAHAPDHEHHAAKPLVIDPADPYSPCSAYPDPYAPSCWLFQGFVILKGNGFNTGRALRVCDGAPAGRVGRCYESVGLQIAGLFQRDDGWILEQCSEGRPSLAPRCAAGAALALDAMDWTGSSAARLCAAAPTNWKDACYRSAAGTLTDLTTPTGRAHLCANIETAYVTPCRMWAGLDGAATAKVVTRPGGTGS
jgi:hypothetical protein